MTILENVVLFVGLLVLFAFFYGLFLIIFRRGRRLRGTFVVLGAFFTMIALGLVISGIEDRKAQQAGFSDHADKAMAASFDIVDPEEWMSRKAELIAARTAKEQAEAEVAAAERAAKEAKQKAQAEAAAAARETELIAEKARKAAEAAAKKEAERQAKLEADREKAEEKRKGFHCLSPWDGTHRAFRRDVVEQLRDPDSFDHMETRVTPVSEEGTHRILMKFRARNGFGGMNINVAKGQYRNSDCAHVVTSIE